MIFHDASDLCPRCNRLYINRFQNVYELNRFWSTGDVMGGAGPLSSTKQERRRTQTGGYIRTMASRRATIAPSTLKTSTENKSSKNATNRDDGAAKKKPKASGTVVKSRYLQPVEKTGSLSKSNSANESVIIPPAPSSPKPGFAKPRPSSPKPSFAKPRPSSPKPVFAKPRPSSPKPGSSNPRVGTPPRRSMAPLAFPTPMMSNLEPSFVSASMLQSTFTEGGQHRPDYDLSVINENTVIQNIMEAEKNPENDKDDIEMNTFLLAYLTAKMGHNNAKLRAEMDARLREEMEEDDRLHKQVQEMKRQHLLREKEKILHELLDLQIAALEPVVDAAKLFTEDYKSFGSAIDTTRHELPVKNIHIEGDRRQFLDKAEACLKDGERILMDCAHGDHADHGSFLKCLRDIKRSSKDISHELSEGFSELLELSGLVSRHASKSQQAMEEEQLGSTRIHELHGSM